MAKTLLVVDDEVSFLEVVQLKFKKEIETKEYEILTASSGEEALKKIEEDREHKIDLLLTDLKMPAASIDGFKLIRILREQNICLKKLVISAYADQENFRMALKENVVDFLAKPINLLELKPLVEEILQLPDQIDPQSTKVNVNTLYKLVRQLPSQQKAGLILDLVESLRLEELQLVEQELSLKLNQLILTAQEKKKIQDHLAEQIRRGDFDKKNLDIELVKSLDGFHVDSFTVPGQNGKVFGPYYRIRWKEGNKPKSIYFRPSKKKT